MKLSKYNYFKKTAAGYIAYNTKTCNLKKISDEEYSILIQNNNSLWNEKFLKRFSNFLTDENSDEIKSILSKREEYLERPKDYKRYTICPTLDCNAKCFYCYENGCSKSTMSFETAREIVDFIKKDSQNVSKIKLYWYGGEPLLAIDIIDYISKELILFCETENKSYRSNIASNISLLDDNVLEKMIAWKIEKVEFAFDGDALDHNEIKDYSDKNINAFEHNMSMMQKLIEMKIKTQIRFNARISNYEQIFNVLEELLKKYGTNEYFIPYIGIIFATGTSNQDYLGKNDIKKYMMRYWELCYKYKKINSYKDLPLGPKTNNCYATNKDAITIGPSGIITPCQICPDDQKAMMGNTKINYNTNEWYDISPTDMCKKCAFYPKCLGGCTGQWHLYGTPGCFNEKFYILELIDFAFNLMELDGIDEYQWQ